MTSQLNIKNGKQILCRGCGGIYTSEQLQLISELANDIIVRATEDQRLALVVDKDEVDSIINQFEKVGISYRQYKQGLRQPVCDFVV